MSALAAEPEAPVLNAADCAREIKRMRYERERAELQREIERLRDQGGADDTIWQLSQRKIDLLHRIESLR